MAEGALLAWRWLAKKKKKKKTVKVSLGHGWVKWGGDMSSSGFAGVGVGANSQDRRLCGQGGIIILRETAPDGDFDVGHARAAVGFRSRCLKAGAAVPLWHAFCLMFSPGRCCWTDVQATCKATCY